METIGILPKFILTISCVSPILFTYSFIAYHEGKYWLIFLFLLSAAVLALLCKICLNFVSKKSYSEKVNVVNFKPADKEISGYFVSYLLPLISASDEFYKIDVSIFFAVMFFIFIFASKSFYSNPILSLMGYKFYEITISTGGSLLLVTKEDIINCKQIERVAYATKYTVVTAKE